MTVGVKRHALAENRERVVVDVLASPLAEKLLKVSLQVDHAKWNGEAIIVQDTNGHQLAVSLARAR